MRLIVDAMRFQSAECIIVALWSDEGQQRNARVGQTAAIYLIDLLPYKGLVQNKADIASASKAVPVPKPDTEGSELLRQCAAEDCRVIHGNIYGVGGPHSDHDMRSHETRPPCDVSRERQPRRERRRECGGGSEMWPS
jgi:hypothetical protein